MTGTLGLFSLVDLFQLLAASARSGRLAIDHPAGKARVFFDEGRVVHAEFAELEGEQAVYALFADEQGSFEFMLGVPPPRNTIATKTESLVLEASRRLDEARRNGKSTLDTEGVPGFSDSSSSFGDLTLNQAEVELLRRVDGRRSVGEIARSLQLEPEAVQAAVRRLRDVGILRLAGRRPRTARLVTRLATRELPIGTGGVDPTILDAWQRSLGHPVEAVACRRPDGRVRTLAVTPLAKAGPYLMLSRDTLLRVDLTVNQALLVRPLPAEAAAQGAPGKASGKRRRSGPGE